MLGAWLESTALVVGTYAVFMAGLWWMYFRWLPRIVGPDRIAGDCADPR